MYHQTLYIMFDGTYSVNTFNVHIFKNFKLNSHRVGGKFDLYMHMNIYNIYSLLIGPIYNI